MLTEFCFNTLISNIPIAITSVFAFGRVSTLLALPAGWIGAGRQGKSSRTDGGRWPWSWQQAGCSLELSSLWAYGCGKHQSRDWNQMITVRV